MKRPFVPLSFFGLHLVEVQIPRPAMRNLHASRGTIPVDFLATARVAVNSIRRPARCKKRY